MLRVVFLCSGGGGNLRFIAEAIHLGILENSEICGVITDRECPASIFAKLNNIPVSECDFSENNQPDVMKRLIELDPGVIVSNVHKILSPVVVDSFYGKLINLHYSLLPAFGGVIGAKALNQALDYGVQLVGTTVHLVDDLLDGGSPIIQAAIPVSQGDEVPTLMDIVFRTGCISLLTGMRLIRDEKQTAPGVLSSIIEISGRSVLFNPPVAAVTEFQEESFWRRLE